MANTIDDSKISRITPKKNKLKKEKLKKKPKR